MTRLPLTSLAAGFLAGRPMLTRNLGAMLVAVIALAALSDSASADTISGVSCPSTEMCVGAATGSIVWTNPTAPAPAWTEFRNYGLGSVQDVACPSTGLCVLAANSGRLFSSTQPTNPNSWQQFAPGNEEQDLNGIACPSTEFCIAVGQGGNAMVSRTPASGGWSVVHIANVTLTSVACANESLCVAMDFAGNVWTSTDPGANRQWSIQHLEDTDLQFQGIACPGVSACLSIGPSSTVYSTQDAASIGSWQKTGAIGSLLTWSRTLRPGSAVRGATSTVSVVGNNRLSCPSVELCVTTTYAYGGAVMASTRPFTATAWTVTPATEPQDVSCATTSWCVEGTADGTGLVSSNPGDPVPSWAPIAAAARTVPAAHLASVTASSLTGVGKRKPKLSVTLASTWSADPMDFIKFLASPSVGTQKGLFFQVVARRKGVKVTKGLTVTSGGQRVPFTARLQGNTYPTYGGWLSITLARKVTSATVTLSSPLVLVDPTTTRRAQRKQRPKVNVWVDTSRDSDTTKLKVSAS